MNNHPSHPENNIQTNPQSQNPIAGLSKILVAVDYLTSTPKVFEQAMQLAQVCGSRLMVFHCVAGKMPGMSEIATAVSMGAYSGVYSQEIVALEEELLQETTTELQAWLQSFVRQATQRGIPSECDYAIGNPGLQICAIAQDWSADLIMIGRRGRTGLAEMILGSVSNYVVHHAPCSVMVIQL
jgi:nucleotide-binding universal stress UspA family protein